MVNICYYGTWLNILALTHTRKGKTMPFDNSLMSVVEFILAIITYYFLMKTLKSKPKKKDIAKFRKWLY